jgi:dihydroxy-acid dehydratase
MVDSDKHTNSTSTSTKSENGRAAVGETYELNKYSKTLTQDPTLPAAQAMLYGIGLTDDDLKKAQVGVVSTGYDGNTCNMHLNKLAQEVKTAVWDNDLVGLMFHTIGVSDGMSNGTEGMRYSLVSREVIADSIETVCGNITTD